MMNFFLIPKIIIERIIKCTEESNDTYINKRTTISSPYLQGLGIEIGPLCNPFIIPDKAQVIYIDRYNSQKLRDEYPELKNFEIVEPDIITDGESINCIKSKSLNFVIASHVLEHMANPIGALLKWLDVLKNDGYLILVVPHHNNNLDKGREISTINHIINDYFNPSLSNDYNHYKEIIRYWQKCENPHEIETRANDLFIRKYSIHYHVFNMELLDDIINFVRFRERISLQIVKKENLQVEYMYVIKKI